MSQPEWRTLYQTDYSMVQIDKTGVYAPEMEIAQEIGGGKWQVFRFSLDKLKKVKHDGKVYLIPDKWDASWPYPASSYEEWFAKDLPQVANSIGAEVSELRTALCSKDPKQRAWAYESIGGYHGFDNLDSYPETYTEDEFNERWHESAHEGGKRKKAPQSGRRRVARKPKRPSLGKELAAVNRMLRR